jgi:hypothetical protein
MATTSTPARPTGRGRPAGRPSRPVWRAGLVAAGVAGAANLAVFAFAWIAGAPFRVRFSPHQAALSITAGDVLGATVMALGLGTAFAVLGVERHRHGIAAAQAIGAAVALVSLSVPLSTHRHKYKHVTTIT